MLRRTEVSEHSAVCYSSRGDDRVTAILLHKTVGTEKDKTCMEFVCMEIKKSISFTCR